MQVPPTRNIFVSYSIYDIYYTPKKQKSQTILTAKKKKNKIENTLSKRTVNGMEKQGTKKDRYITHTTKAIAAICLECPLPKCPKSECKRFREEKRKLENGECGR